MYALNSLRIDAGSYDVKIYRIEPHLPVEDILARVDSFVQEERSHQRFVGKVTLPCIVNRENEYEVNRCMPEPSYSLWLIQYKNGVECTYGAYDDVNDVLTLNPVVAQSTVVDL